MKHVEMIIDYVTDGTDFEYCDNHGVLTRCRDCGYWIPGFISDNDHFIPPKCGKYQQMVGHSADDYCSYAERREVSE